MMHWVEQKVALLEQVGENNITMIFSGSAVVDINNTSGFQTVKGGSPPYVLIYTAYVISLDGKIVFEQNQNLAYSTDINGTDWKFFEGNPVLRIPGEINFRDPKVMWYAAEQKWVMSVSLSAE